MTVGSGLFTQRLSPAIGSVDGPRLREHVETARHLWLDLTAN